MLSIPLRMKRIQRISRPLSVDMSFNSFEDETELGYVCITLDRYAFNSFEDETRGVGHAVVGASR